MTRAPARPASSAALTGGRRSRPVALAHAAFLLALSVLIGLGAWQIERREWKRDLIAARMAALAAPPLTLPTETKPVDFRAGSAEGVPLTDRLFKVIATGENGLGFRAVVPVRLEGGTLLLVDRGFVPDIAAAASISDLSPAQSRRFEGRIRLPRAPGVFTPENDPARGVWYTIDPTAMARASGLPLVEAYYLEIESVDPPRDAFPRPAPPPPDLPNDHLNYAITWLSLAALLFAGYLRFLMMRRAARRSSVG